MDTKQIAREIVEESVVLLKNEEQILPFSKQQKIAFFGRAQLQTYTSGNGSGATKGAKENNILLACEKAGICVHAQLKSYYLAALQAEAERPEEEFDFAHMKDLIHSGLMYEVFGKYHAPAKEYDIPDELLRNVRSYTETAVVVIGRNAGGEECDRHLKNDYELTESEKRLIDQVCGTFQKVVLILNINGLIDLKWTKQYPAVKGILFLGIPGEEGAAALAEILLGAVNPSGKLSVTIAENFEDYPSARHFSWDKESPEQLLTYESYGLDAIQNGSCGFEKSPVTVYVEDIYAGYRYFDTFCKKPLYPFGFGLSYTRFEIKVQHIQEQDHGVRIEVRVKNVGSCSGKEVVQMYLSAENTKEERAYQELKGFEKTKLLKPGENERISLCLPWEEFSYYDEELAAFQIGKGIYKIRIGCSSVHTELAGTIEVQQKHVVKQCANRLGIKECNLGKIKFRTENNTKTFKRKEYSLQEKNYIPDETMDLSELSIDELAALCVGYGPGVPFSAFGEGDDPETIFDKNGRPLTCNSHPTGMNGYVSPAILEKGIYSVSYKDGPAGIGRTAWPSEMLISCAFDRSIWRKYGDAVGMECEKEKVDVWLAPAVNLQRHPLGGRNFEYFSEDPYLTAVCACEVTKGVQGNHPVIVCPKHFAVNEQETFRRGNAKKNYDAVDSVLTERAARELYLKPFEMLVKDAGISCVMTSFNKINGVFAGGNKDLCTYILREEWGYQGAVITDWGDMDIVVDGADAIAAGNDIVMPGGPPVIRQILKGYEEGRVTRENLETAVANLLLMVKSIKRNRR